MIVKHSSKTGEIKITLTSAETAQFLASSAAVQVVRDAIKQVRMNEPQRAKGFPMKVRKGSVYRFKACGWDRFDRHENTPADGTMVRVCAPRGCPPPNTMNHCFVETIDGQFIGLVCCGSLTK